MLISKQKNNKNNAHSHQTPYVSRARSDPIYYIFSVPGEIKRREVELDPQVSPEEIMSREMELDSQVSPEEIMSGEVELACESWTSFASGCSSTAVQRTLSL